MLLLYSISFVTISISSGASALWTHPTPTKNSDNEQSTNRWTPKPTNPPILNPRQSTSAACGVLHGNPSMAVYIMDLHDFSLIQSKVFRTIASHAQPPKLAYGENLGGVAVSRPQHMIVMYRFAHHIHHASAVTKYTHAIQIVH